MKYPIVTLDNARRFTAARRDDSPDAPSKPEVGYRGSDEGLPVLAVIEDDLELLLETFRSERGGVSPSDKDAFEGRLVAILHPALRRLPAAVLSDRDFWRYLATYWLFEIGVWRDGKDGALPTDDTFGCSTSGLHPDTLPLRMFNRGEVSVGAAGDGEGPYDIAAIGAADVWKSHILRTLNWQSPLVARALLEGAASKELPTQVMRDVVKRIKRARANVQTEVLTGEQVAALVERQRLAAVAIAAEPVAEN